MHWHCQHSPGIITIFHKCLLPNFLWNKVMSQFLLTCKLLDKIPEGFTGGSIWKIVLNWDQWTPIDWPNVTYFKSSLASANLLRWSWRHLAKTITCIVQSTVHSQEKNVEITVLSISNNKSSSNVGQIIINVHSKDLYKGLYVHGLNMSYMSAQIKQMMASTQIMVIWTPWRSP